MVGHKSVDTSASFSIEPLFAHIEIFRIDLKANAIPSPKTGGHVRRSGAHEGIENGVSDKAEHPDETFSQFNRVWSRVLLCRCSGDLRPNLLKPNFMQVSRV